MAGNMLQAHFLDVGCGNMALIQLPDRTALLYDCNVTAENQSRILGYLKQVLGESTHIAKFINSHRDADHMRGIELVHAQHPIDVVWDSGVTGTSTDTPEYRTYMRLRSQIGYTEIDSKKLWTFGDVVVRCLNSKDEDMSDANDQSLVLKIEYAGNSVLLAGDTSFSPWKSTILPYYGDRVHSTILLASHHGSRTFFDDPGDERNYYVAHLKKINPDMTIVSVGPNVHDLPDNKAMELYEKYSSGSNKGNKVYSTEDKGSMRLSLKEGDGWSLTVGVDS